MRRKPKTKQKPKLTQRNIALSVVFFLSTTTIILMLVLNLSSPNVSQATTNPQVDVIIVKDEVLITDKSINEVKVKPKTAKSAHTIYVRPVIGISNQVAN